MVAGLQGGMAVAGAAAGAGAAGAACCCRKKPQRREKRYRAGEEERGCGAQRRRKAGEERDVEGAEVEQGRGGAEDGFRPGQLGEQIIEMPETPPPSYAKLASPEGEGIELEARPVGKGEVSKEV
jgi:hypothetical protein